MKTSIAANEKEWAATKSGRSCAHRSRNCAIWLMATSSCRMIWANFGRLSPSCCQQRTTMFDSSANTSSDGGVSPELVGGADGMGGRSPCKKTDPRIDPSERPAHGRSPLRSSQHTMAKAYTSDARVDLLLKTSGALYAVVPPPPFADEAPKVVVAMPVARPKSLIFAVILSIESPLKRSTCAVAHNH